MSSKYPDRVPEASELRELVQLLRVLLESANRLPKGPEKQAAIKTISGYQNQMSKLIRRSGSAMS
jgi:hypothetical protein